MPAAPQARTATYELSFPCISWHGACKREKVIKKLLQFFVRLLYLTQNARQFVGFRSERDKIECPVSGLHPEPLIWPTVTKMKTR